jgi:hypothetical protein
MPLVGFEPKISARMGAPYIYDISRLRVNIPMVMKSGSLKLLETARPVQDSPGVSIPFTSRSDAVAINIVRFFLQDVVHTLLMAY